MGILVANLFLNYKNFTLFWIISNGIMFLRIACTCNYFMSCHWIVVAILQTPCLSSVFITWGR